MAFISSTSRGFSPAACRMRATVSWTYFWQWFPWKLYVQKCPIWRPCKISLSFIHPLNSSSRNKVWAGFSLCNCRLRKNWWLSRAATSGCMSPPFCFSCQVLWRWSGARASQHWRGWVEIGLQAALLCCFYARKVSEDCFRPIRLDDRYQ